jgi:hypothetical protein
MFGVMHARAAKHILPYDITSREPVGNSFTEKDKRKPIIKYCHLLPLQLGGGGIEINAFITSLPPQTTRQHSAIEA